MSVAWIVACAAVFVPPQGKQGKPENPIALIARAEELLGEDRREEAVLALWRAQRGLLAMAPNLTREAARRSADTLLARADPLDERRRAVCSEVAEHLADLAKLYRRRGWLDMAERRIRRARQWDPTAGEDELGRIEYVRTKAGDRRAEPEPEPGEEPEPDVPLPLDHLRILHENGGSFEVGEDSVRSPPLGPEGVYLYASEPGHEDARITVDMLLGEKKAKATFLFGVAAVDDCFLATVHQRPEANHLSLALSHWKEPGLTVLATKEHVWSRAQCLAGADVELEVKGKTIRARIRGYGWFEAEAPRPAHGGVGFMVSKDSPNPDPVLWRRLRIGPLEEEEEGEAGEGGEGAATDLLAAGLTQRLAEAEEELGGPGTEAGVIELLELRAELTRLSAGVLRDSLISSTEECITEHDPFAAGRREDDIEAAEALAGLAREYRDAEMPRLAHRFAVAAADLDPAHAGLQAGLEEVVAVVGGPGEVPAEADREVDNQALVEWFSEHRRPFGGAEWEIGPDGAKAPELEDGRMALIVSPKPGRGPARLSVQLRPKGAGAQGGLAFGSVGTREVFVALVGHAATASHVMLFRWVGREWKLLGRKEVPFSAAAREGWMTMVVEYDRERISVRAGRAEPLVVAAPETPVFGGFGLFCGHAGGQPGSFGFRNFVPPEPPGEDDPRDR